MSASDAELSKWKRRVLEVEQELEAAGEREQLLLKMLGRLSAVAEGVDEQLDDALPALRANLERGASRQLERQWRSLERDMLRLFARRDEALSSSLQALNRLVAQLQGLPLDEPLVERLKQLKESLPEQVRHYYLHPAIHRELMDIQEQALDALDEPTWAPEVDDQLLRRVSRLLSDLLGQLAQLDSQPDSARELRDELHRSSDWEGVLKTLEASVRLSLRLLDRTQAEFGEYLQQLNQQLADIKVVLSDSREHASEAQEATARFGETLQGGVAQMQRSVTEATDLQQLKSAVRGQLADIAMAMAHYQTSQSDLQRQAQQRIQEMEGRVADLEANAAETQARILEQRRQALLDPLTQLPNRAAYDERLAQEYARWSRYREPLVLAVCDLDHFKKINDTFGHQAGDKVLRLVARLISGRLRETDFMGRYGGEEFVLLLPHTGLPQAQQVVDALREVVYKSPFHFKGKPVAVTVSIGLSAFSGGDTPEQVFARADAALYEAKRQGRNRCVTAPE